MEAPQQPLEVKAETPNLPKIDRRKSTLTEEERKRNRNIKQQERRAKMSPEKRNFKTPEQRAHNAARQKARYDEYMATKPCTPNQVFICGKPECQMCKDRSFADHPKAQFWSKKNDKSPIQVARQSRLLITFDCLCGHEFTVGAKSVGNNESWCKYCCEPSQALCENLDCVSCFEKSAASHPMIKQWSPKNNENPRFVFKRTPKKYIFDCTCGHEYTPRMFSFDPDGACPYCSPTSTKICDSADCDRCFKKSFASNYYAKFWSPRNDPQIQPRQIIRGTAKKFWFICEQGHEFERSLNSITFGGSWCVSCHNKTETKLRDILVNLGENVKQQPTFEWCINDRTGRNLRYDFLIERLKLIIELDGDQHLRQVEGWTSIKETRRRDWLKMDLALANGYSIIRVLQQDVMKDKNDWYEIFIDNFQKYDVPEMIFISNQGRYDDFENRFDELPDETPIDAEFDDA